MNSYVIVLKACATKALIARDICGPTGLSLATVRNYISRAVTSGLLVGEKTAARNPEKRYKLSLLGKSEVERAERAGGNFRLHKLDRERMTIPDGRKYKRIPKDKRPKKSLLLEYAESHARHVAMQRKLGITDNLIFEDIQGLQVPQRKTE